jgi:hypothetical protein
MWPVGFSHPGNWLVPATPRSEASARLEPTTGVIATTIATMAVIIATIIAGAPA